MQLLVAIAAKLSYLCEKEKTQECKIPTSDCQEFPLCNKREECMQTHPWCFPILVPLHQPASERVEKEQRTQDRKQRGSR